jgi:hypothetical protein
LLEISPQVHNDLNNIVKTITDYTIWDSYTYDPIVEDLVKIVVQSIEEHNVSQDVTTSSNPSIVRISNQPMQREST